MPRSGRSQPPENRRFDPSEASQAKERLQRRIDELKALDRQHPEYVRTADLALDTANNTVRDIFGASSDEAITFVSALMDVSESARMNPHLPGRGNEAFRATAKVMEAIPRLESLLRIVDEKTVNQFAGPRPTATAAEPRTRRVFLVHGHNEAVKQSVARILEKLALEPVILHEKPDMNRTIIEKFEAHADVAFAVILLTGDDRGGPILESPQEYKPRARQNVIFEMGFFLGRLGRRNVCVLYEPGVEMLSDYSGVLYKELDTAGRWQFELAREIDAVGIHIDFNRLK